MSTKKPLVLDSGLTEQLQSQDDLDIPLNERVDLLETQMRDLAKYLVLQGIEMPPTIIWTSK